MMPQALPQSINPDYVVLIDGVYYDLCVFPSCKTNTGIRTDCPIERRKHYIEGCGQLCEKCWFDPEHRGA